MRLSIIIPFLNEGKEVENTLKSIRDTASGELDIVLINDGSDDGFDYESAARLYSCNYIVHRKRHGVAASRQEGIKASQSPLFLLLDAHMRFYDQGWDEILCRHIEANPHALLCCQTRILQKGEDSVITEINRDKTYCGGFIDTEIKEQFKVCWMHADLEPYSDIVEIPCVLGAAYACNRPYWERLHGLEGLLNYGTDEEFISMKVWREGGRCLLIKNLAVGHIYRKEFPYVNIKPEVLYNRLLAIELLFPADMKQKLFNGLHLALRADFERAYDLLRRNYKAVKTEKQYLNSIFSRDINWFMEFNDRSRNIALGADRGNPVLPENIAAYIGLNA